MSNYLDKAGFTRKEGCFVHPTIVVFYGKGKEVAGLLRVPNEYLGNPKKLADEYIAARAAGHASTPDEYSYYVAWGEEWDWRDVPKCKECKRPL